MKPLRLSIFQLEDYLLKTIAYIACSMDGYIARPDGDIEWLTQIPNPEHSNYGYGDFLKTIDAVLLGRNTFELTTQFPEWPYSKPVFVLSTTLRQLPPRFEGKVEVLNGPLTRVLETLENRGITNLYVDGGTVIRSLLREDRLDEMIITTVPVVLGGGIPLFGETAKTLAFDLVRSEIINHTMVKTCYRRIRQ